ncbi:MAG: glucose-1-phosphate adenylyltransferase [Betaproteobacteria bacterium]|nr:glucose-1-phosphate adenylyltransferase [Betaproteobacteria bacterium]
MKHGTSETQALVLAGGRGTRLKQLTDADAKPAVPFGGQFRIIDFTLSNCINSGLRHIAVLTQYKAQSLIRHIMQEWEFLDSSMGEFIDVVPAQQRVGEGWYSGTADAVFQNLQLLRDTQPRYLLVLAGDHVYKMDYGRMLAEHAQRGADVSVASIDVPLDLAPSFGIMEAAGDGRIRSFKRSPRTRAPATPGRRRSASMGIYLFNASALYEALDRDAGDTASGHDFGHDVIPRLLPDARIYAHDFARSCVNLVGSRPYWRDVGTLDAYWEANMDLVQPQPELNLYDEAWPIRSQEHHLPPAKFVFDDEGRRGKPSTSLVASGCIVSGATVRRSVLSCRARVEEGSVVEDSLVLPSAVVGRGVVLRRSIVGERCVLPDGIRIGVDAAADRARYTVSDRA